ncbi:MAG: hypothetical protein R3F07_03980 [Opitutaceae bacterium]
MSHWSDIRTEFVSLKTIEAALKELGNGRTCLLLDEKIALGYGGNRKECDCVIRGGIHYDVAVNVSKEDGKISLTTDFYTYKNGGPKEDNTRPVGEVLGGEFSKLKAYYAAHKSYAEARRRGIRASMHRVNGGSHEMRARNGRWQAVNASIWTRVKNRLPFRETKQENASRLWVQCEV